MSPFTLKTLHSYLRLLENAAELKRKMPTSSSLRTMKEGLFELSKLVGIDEATFRDPQNIAALVGGQRFVMIWREPSVCDHVARVFDSTRVLLMVLVEPGHFSSPSSRASGPTSGGAQSLSSGGSAANLDPAYSQGQVSPPSELPPDNLKSLLSGNTALTCRLFRALFEHMLGFSSPTGAQQGTVLLVNELVGNREHSRSFLSTALFILGAEIDRENLMSFMLEQGLFGMHIFEHMLQNRNYCDAFYAFRHLERAFVDSSVDEELRFRNRMDRVNTALGGKACEMTIFEADDQDKARIDAYLAAADLLDALALTPWSLSLSQAIAASPANSIRSVRILARHFERFADGEITQPQANQKIADHLLAFASQFSADSKSP